MEAKYIVMEVFLIAFGVFLTVFALYAFIQPRVKALESAENDVVELRAPVRQRVPV